MRTVTQASQYFDRLPSGSKEAFNKLSSLILDTTPERESEWLDYKNGRDFDISTIEGKDKVRELWGKALSGFANSGGGLVIWGIQTVPVNNHDVPKNLALVPNPEKLEGLLKNYLASEIEPPVLYVRFHSITNEAGEGFVVADIPPSDLKPHLSRFHGKYFIRASHQHVVAGPSLLRILFHPSAKPVLELLCDSPDGSPGLGFIVRFRLFNRGFATASDVLIFISDKKGALNFHPHDDAFGENGNGRDLCRLRAKHSLHPSLGVLMGRGLLLPGNDPYIVKVFGKDFEPCKWSVTVGFKQGEVNVSGPFSIFDGEPSV